MKLDTKELQKITLLYVEDDEAILSQMEMLFGKIFKKLYIATDGEQGLEVYKEHQNEIDVVVTDINMPNMNGLDMIKEINKLPTNIPKIVTTAHTDTDHLLNAFDLKVDKYIPKPVQIKELTVAVVDLVVKYRKANNLEVLAKGLVQKNNQTDLEKQTLQQQLDIKTKELNYYETIVDNFVVKFQTSKTGDIVSCSSKFLRFFDFTSEEIIGKNISVLKCESCKEQSFQQLMLKAIHTKKTITSSHTFITNSGKTTTCDVTMTPRYGSDMLVNGYIFYLDLV